MTARGARVALRPLAAADAPALRAMAATPDVRAWWGPVRDDFPLADEPEATRFTVLEHGEVAGLIQFGEEPDRDFRHAWVDLLIDPRRRGRGLGGEALAALVRHLVEERGHHRVTIDPALDNEAAIRCYEKAGFRRVGVMRSAWRDASGNWRDVLLMELVVEP